MFTFFGGICPPTCKTEATALPIQFPPLADHLMIPIQQHSGEKGEILVSPGDSVKRGQMLVAATSFMSVAVHAPIAGKVVAIELYAVPHASGLMDTCIHLQADSEPLTSVAFVGIPDYLEADTSTLLEKIRMSGIAGLGGAGFPTDVKLQASPIHTLIINGAECEPYICADDVLMRERATDILKGVLILGKLTDANQCFLAIEEDKPEAITAMKQALAAVKHDFVSSIENDFASSMEIVTIPTRYPSGGERQLIKILTNEEVPSGVPPGAIGIHCQNVATAYSVYQAVADGIPLMSRIVTLTGQALANPMNVEAPIGTPIDHLLAFAGLQSDQLDQVLMGGPLMGVPIHALQTPITKVSNCLLAAGVGELRENALETACIRCGYCAEVCPSQLLPQQLYWYTQSEEWDKAQQHHLFDCIECGACAYVCPSHIPLVQYYRYGKGEIRKAQHAHQKSDKARERFEFRQDRLQREADEKALKRQQRLQQATVTDKTALETDGATVISEAGAPKETIDNLSKETIDNLNKINDYKANEQVLNDYQNPDGRQLGAANQPHQLTQSRHAVEDSHQVEYSSVGGIGSVEIDSLQPPESLLQSAHWLALEQKIRMTEDRLEQAKARAKMAEQQQLDSLETLTRALDKQTVKLNKLLEERKQHLLDSRGHSKMD